MAALAALFSSAFRNAELAMAFMNAEFDIAD